MSEMIVGIDLGTTNSAVACCRDGRVDILPVEGEPTMPSCVGLDANGELTVGRAARNQYVYLPDQTIVSVKRRMGENLKLPLGDRQYLPQEISAIILRRLKQAAETALGLPVNKAVITVPAYFNDAQRHATREAGAIAGLEVVRIINEPTAACLAYETHRPLENRSVLAFDLGGGTFDVSVVHLDGELVEVFASHGDNHLGGDDFDQILCEELIERLELAAGPGLDAVSLNRLRRAAEEAKIRLSDDDSTRIIEEGLKRVDGSTLDLDTELSRSQFEELIAPLLHKTLLSVRKALSLADKRAADIHDVLLVGGATRSPVVARMLRDELAFVARNDLHPDLAVAYGAGVMAGRLMGVAKQRILVDVTPYTFGTSALGVVRGNYGPHRFCPIITAGTPLPVTKTETFFTVNDGQQAVDINIFEGESEDARDNILIGRFEVDGLDRQAPEGNPIAIRMSLNLDGILTVAATEKSTGLGKHVRIDRAMERLADEQLAEARRQVAALFGEQPLANLDEIDAADDEEPDDQRDDRQDDRTAPAAGEESRAKARVLARRLKNKLPELDAVDREDAEQLLARLQEALDNADQQAANTVAADIEDLLFYVESSA